MKEQILKHLPVGHPWSDRVHWLAETDSTNNRAKALAQEGAPYGTIVIAGSQTAGKGRLGRSFHSPAGLGIYMSILLRPRCEAEDMMHLTCAAAVAVCDAIQQETQFQPGIKWTNDLIAGNKKLGGILTELVTADQTCAIIGIGINCNHAAEDFPPELGDIACSLSAVLHRTVSAAAIAARIITAIADMDAALISQKAGILERYRKNCVTLQKDVSFVRSGSTVYARATDISPNGALIVTFPDGHTEAISSGEVSVRGLYGYV